ncbi:hypothetical protein EBR96_04935, partial [bacterium]|nr:hypothetical protein [bacterium]
MYIVYDFETSSRDILGQIIGFCFVVLTQDWKEVDRFSGLVRLNRTQIPDLDALLVTQIKLSELEMNGISESQAAKSIAAFLNNQLDRYRTCALVGYNSNRFDLNFLRNLLIRYGINPYFYGRLSNIDALHFVQDLAVSNPDNFPWTAHSDAQFWTFSLESIATAFGTLSGRQAHSADADVDLLIATIRKLETDFGRPLSTFMPVRLPGGSVAGAVGSLVKQRCKGVPPVKLHYRYWKIVAVRKSELLLLDLERYQNYRDSPASNPSFVDCLTYFNPNKAYLSCDPLDANEMLRFQEIAAAADQDPSIREITLDSFFELTKKEWDIEYRIHDMGFERIERLSVLIRQLNENPSSYETIVNSLWARRQNEKDVFLVQLFNRYYLNCHPDPNPAHIAKYFNARYVSRTMVRDAENSPTIDQMRNKANEIIAFGNSPIDVEIAREFLAYLKRA